MRAAEIAPKCGADGITIHLREDRRHIRDEDLARVKDATNLPINLEMAVTDEMISNAVQGFLTSRDAQEWLDTAMNKII